MKPRVALLVILSLSPFIFGCSGTTASLADSYSGLRGKLTVTGSSTLAPLVMEMAKRFEQLHPATRINVQSGGSGKGITDVRNDVTDIGMASRSLKAGETQLIAHQIAADGVCLIAHASNPITELTDQRVSAIFTDRVNNWSELGGPSMPITVVHKAEGRATLDVFLDHFRLVNTQVKPDVIVGDNEHGVKTVAAARGAIGYVSIATAQADANAGVPIRLLAVGGTTPTIDNVASGSFPMTRPLNLVTTETPSSLATAFIEFCQSEAVRDLVVAHHFVPTQAD